MYRSQIIVLSGLQNGITVDSIPGLGRSLEGGNGNPLQYSYLENPMDRGAWQATVPGVTRVGHNLATKTPPRYNCMYQSHNALYNYLDNTNVSENI